jgi:hypothetical protein
MDKKTIIQLSIGTKNLRKMVLGVFMLGALPIFGQSSLENSKKVDGKTPPISAKKMADSPKNKPPKTPQIAVKKIADTLKTSAPKTPVLSLKKGTDSLKNSAPKTLPIGAKTTTEIPRISVVETTPISLRKLVPNLKSTTVTKPSIAFQHTLAIIKNSNATTQPMSVRKVVDSLEISGIPNLPSFAKSVAIGLNIGLPNGIGVDVAYRFSKHLAVKMAVNYADYAQKDIRYSYTTTVNGIPTQQVISMDASVNLSNAALNFEYSPGRLGRFRLIGGLAYFPKNTLIAGGQTLSNIKFNDVILNSDDIGSGTIQIGFSQPISPFIGMGLGRTFPRKRLNIGLDLGTQYKGDYTVKINVKQGLLTKQNEENAVKLARNFNEKWYGHFFPVVNLRLAYRIR